MIVSVETDDSEDGFQDFRVLDFSQLVLFIGTRKLVERKEFERYISEKAVI